MGEHREAAITIPPLPAIYDTISLRNVQLPLPSAPEAWHRSGKRQPCTVSVRLSYSSATESAAADDVSLTLDYGKMYRRIEKGISGLRDPESVANHRQPMNFDGSAPKIFTPQDPGQDVHHIAGIISSCAFDLLTETAMGTREKNPRAMQPDFGRCEVLVHLPKAILRADGGLTYQSITAMGHKPSDGPLNVLLSEEFRIPRIRCYAILGINPHERTEKQAVIISLTLKGGADDVRRSEVLETYQKMTRQVAETVDSTDFQSVEALATLVARIVVVDFSNEEVTVLVEKPNALAFSEGTGIELTRSREFFA
ncbi:unnamed protein product [Penicillium salamii]|nr:unnamed protein product [Penicillium salamii]CAG8402417.1 unnamed protein product [Penicillium salamii]